MSKLLSWSQGGRAFCAVSQNAPLSAQGLPLLSIYRVSPKGQNLSCPGQKTSEAVGSVGIYTLVVKTVVHHPSKTDGSNQRSSRGKRRLRCCTLNKLVGPTGTGIGGAAIATDGHCNTCCRGQLASRDTARANKTIARAAAPIGLPCLGAYSSSSLSLLWKAA